MSIGATSIDIPPDANICEDTLVGLTTPLDIGSFDMTTDEVLVF